MRPPTTQAHPNRDRHAQAGHAGALQEWTAACPPIDPGRILRLHGYTERDKVRPAIRSAADSSALQAASLVAASGCWRRVGITGLSNGELHLTGGVTLACPAFDRLLDGANEVVVFVLTLGAGFDRAVVELIEKFEPLEALFMETAGRLAIEKLTRVFASDIGEALRPEGLKLGSRLGPGYSYRASANSDAERVMWPLEQQHDLFRVFQSAPLPVELRDSCVMVPKMSRSGLIGLSRAA